MGVHGLWDLLAPVGRRVSVETLAGKRLAIDASIWMVQFMKAMRDEKGEMVRNAHLLGFFRRICKLLFLRTKPVFVFDGGTPALKRRTVIARRRQRENAQAKIRKTAEKLLLNHVKAMRLKMLAEDLKDQKAKNNSKGMEVLVDQSDASGKNDMALEGHNQEAIDEMLVASILAEERGGLFGNASTSAAPIGSDSGNARADASAPVTDFLTQDEDDEDVEEMIRGRAKRLKHLAEDLKDQKDKNYSKAKEVMVDRSDRLEKNNVALEGHKQEMIDKMLAASILAEDCGALDGNASTSASAIGADSGNASASATAFSAEEEDDESDEEMILPVSDGNVDPAVLAALPPSMQLDLLAQMREKLMAENRQKYQKVKKAPKKFSELQIEAYLKTVAFRREIDQVQKAASGRGMAGVQTSRIASETNREFIFSSSFSGDKQLLTSGKAEENAEKQQRTEKKDSSFDVLNSIGSSTKCNPGAEPTADEPAGDFVNDVQTFLDERGRMRVSRRRAMGIRMTRDLERNIELMKEFEQDRTTAHNLETAPFKLDRNEGASGKFHSEGQSFNAVYELNGDTVPNSTEKSLLEAETHEDDLSQKNENCIKISFDDDGENRSLDDDDEFFSKLVAEEPVRISSADKPASDYEREKGIIGKECGNLTNKYHLEVNSSLAEDGNINDTDLEWEEGITCNESGSLTNQNKLEANISHEEDGNNESDVEWEEGTSLISEDFKLGMESFDVEEGSTDFHQDASEFSTNVPKTISKGSAEEEAALQEAIRKSLEDLTDGKTSNLSHELENSGYTCKRLLQREGCSLEPSSQLGSAFHDNELSESFVSGTKEKAQIGNGSSVPTHVAGDNLTDSVHVALGDGVTRTKDASLIRNSSEVPDISVRQGTSIMEEHAFHTEVERNMAEENIALTSVQQRGSNVEISMSKNDDDRTIELMGDSLDDELSALGQEYRTLGDEQRKLERSADSVNAEMFVECQELLQMFGLPYIIAPMEAEAQCAYMELANLVDGVVTDDSDVFLFGARSVYKNIFDDRKYVETYFMKDIENELGLNREKLIRMALLLGSDYTEGVSGIGIVNAIEVVNAFPEEDGFHKFREWIESPDPTILGKVAVQPRSSSKKKGSKASKSCKSDSKSNTEGTSTSDCNALHENEDNQAMDGFQKIKKIFMDKHRNVSKNWHIPASFPSDAVISAYISPQVDRSTDPFAWGKPDIFVLRRLCWEKFGWASEKADELLQPVLKEYNKHETQLRLEAFYTFNERFAKIRSKRIKQAVKGITGKRSLELADADDLQKFPETTKRGKVSTSNKTSKREKSTRKGKDPAESLSSEGGCKGLSSETDRRRLNDAESCKLRGKQMRKAVRRGRRKENPNSTDDETSSPDSDSICDDHGNEVRAEKVEFPDNMRRSKRARKATNYVEKDEESDEPTDTQNVSNQTCSNEAAEHKQSHNQSVTTYAAADISRERESASEDPLSGDVVPGDYAVKGGGFCADEDQPEIPSEDASTRYEKEYLQLGGGFCIDENEEDQDLQEQDGSTVAEIITNTSVSLDETEETKHGIDQFGYILSQESVQTLHKCSETDFELNADHEHETRDGNPSNVTEKSKDDADSSVNVFSAIPYLKKKRRT